MRSKLVTLPILCVMLAAPLRGEVTESTTAGFSVRNGAAINAPPAKVYAALTDKVSGWWDPAHTFSHDARNLSVDAKPGGCFCGQAASADWRDWTAAGSGARRDDDVELVAGWRRNDGRTDLHGRRLPPRRVSRSANDRRRSAPRAAGSAENVRRNGSSRRRIAVNEAPASTFAGFCGLKMGLLTAPARASAPAP
jgi:hypothetical protein